MDKQAIVQQVIERLGLELQAPEQAARVAHETATHEENIAENKYDTLGLEAAYLAAGQARRVEEIGQRLLGRRIGDEIELTVAGRSQHHEIIEAY